MCGQAVTTCKWRKHIWLKLDRACFAFCVVSSNPWISEIVRRKVKTKASFKLELKKASYILLFLNSNPPTEMLWDVFVRSTFIRPRVLRSNAITAPKNLKRQGNAVWLVKFKLKRATRQCLNPRQSTAGPSKTNNLNQFPYRAIEDKC